MIALSNRVHIFARPNARTALSDVFTSIFGCGPAIPLEVPELVTPILIFRFPGGGSLSVEFTEEALDERQARYGAWIEVQTDDPATLNQKLLDAGLSQISYLGNSYFQLPGGQILRIVPSSKP